MELLQIISVLCKSEKNNPVLVGDAGVGKTAIVEGLAQLIARGNVPPQLQGKRIRTVEVANIVAGTGVRGQLEEKLQALIKEARDDPSLILFIDEIHMLVGAGATGLHDTMDAANILKPALSRGEITVIGATTHDEYRKNFEKDPALERRFAMVRVPEPTARRRARDPRRPARPLRGVPQRAHRRRRAAGRRRALDPLRDRPPPARQGARAHRPQLRRERACASGSASATST